MVRSAFENGKNAKETEALAPALDAEKYLQLRLLMVHGCSDWPRIRIPGSPCADRRKATPQSLGCGAVPGVAPGKREAFLGWRMATHSVGGIRLPCATPGSIACAVLSRSPATVRGAETTAATTSNEWTDRTWNPVTGCIKISPRCDNFYAATFANRFRDVPGYPFEKGFDLQLRPERLGYPLQWKTPATATDSRVGRGSGRDWRRSRFQILGLDVLVELEAADGGLRLMSATGIDEKVVVAPLAGVRMSLADLSGYPET